MTFLAYCFKCERKVSARTMFDGNELLSALDDDTDVEVMHVSDDDGDHRWKLNRDGKRHLSNHIKSWNR